MEASTPPNTLSQPVTGTTVPHHEKSSTGLHEDDALHHLACDKSAKTECLNTISSYYGKTSMASDADDLSYHSNGEANFQKEEVTTIMHCCRGESTVFEVGDAAGYSQDEKDLQDANVGAQNFIGTFSEHQFSSNPGAVFEVGDAAGHSQGEKDLQGANVGAQNFIGIFSEHQSSSNPCTVDNVSSMELLKRESSSKSSMNVLDDRIIVDFLPGIPHSDPEEGPETDFTTFPTYEGRPSSVVDDLFDHLLSETNSKGEDVRGIIMCYYGDRSEPLGVGDVPGPARGKKDSQGEVEGTQDGIALFADQQSFHPCIIDSFLNVETPKMEESNAEPSVNGSGDHFVNDCLPVSCPLEEECVLVGGGGAAAAAASPVRDVLDDAQASNESKEEIKDEINKAFRSLGALLSSELEENRANCSNEKAGDSTEMSDKGTPTARSLQMFPDSWYDHADSVEYPTGAFSGPIVFSGPISSAVPYPYSGSLSHRSDSTTSTRSFAFPILASDLNTSPATMGQPASCYFRQRQKNHCCCCCWRPSTLFD